ncbi:hypothetical protein [Bacillus taeanensis]|uniref:Uncharacterized protein n=1 Tax=Bacillus taeanensis TaxID=273032 RepID=A0A366XUJ9_9BACI|nr:hypothetical protein [Bacillus taeanensis]RBW68449.1 hypothetical protein DS031_16685 [Bacillus taeanensis]
MKKKLMIITLVVEGLVTFSLAGMIGKSFFELFFITAFLFFLASFLLLKTESNTYSAAGVDQIEEEENSRVFIFEAAKLYFIISILTSAIYYWEYW